MKRSGAIFAAFLLFSILVVSGALNGFDHATTAWLRGVLPIGVALPFAILSLVGSAEFLSLLLLVVLAVRARGSLLYLLNVPRSAGARSQGQTPRSGREVLGEIVRRNGQEILIALLYGLILLIEVAGKKFIPHPGPPIFPNPHFFTVSLPSDSVQIGSSYPSGHTARTAFVSVVFYALLSRKETTSVGVKTTLAVVFVLLNVVMDVSRIYLGAHWASDVVGGVLLGASLGLFAVAWGGSRLIGSGQ